VSQRAGDQLGRYTEMKNEITAIKASVSSADRSVTVVAGPGGSVLDVQLSEQAFGSGSPRSLAGSINSTLRLAVAEAARKQAEIVQKYVGDRLNILDRVMATQEELLGDKIEAGDKEQQRLTEQAQAARGDSVLESAAPQRPAFPPPPQRPPAPPQPQRPQPQQAPQFGAPPAAPPQRPAPPPRPAPRQAPGDDDGFQGFGGSESW
jgi:YbaB/EbfC DNA-binding family